MDAFFLAFFYTIRVYAGAVAIGVELSNWLLTFSCFTFLSLGLLKRFSDIKLLSLTTNSVPGRAYKTSDLPVLMSLGTACAVAATVTLALYVDYSAQTQLYRRPALLWFICPLFFYSISRLWILGNANNDLHDPVEFAVKDKQSLVVAALILLLLILSF
jgi:4-hydroxybenzoate polyprenyltransferase